MSAEKRWKFQEQDQWRITGYLKTKTSLHVGSGEIVFHPELERELESDNKFVEINGILTDTNEQPYIPGSTLKGSLRAWLQRRVSSDSAKILDSLFGFGPETTESEKFAGSPDNGQGGGAEFLDIALIFPRSGTETPLPYWDAGRQVYVETSVAIDRVTRTALDKKLIHTEMVPPGVSFTVTVCGPMKEQGAALLLAALEYFNDEDDPVTLGAGTANGCGRLTWQLNTLEKFGREEAKAWFAATEVPMFADAMKTVPGKERDRLLEQGRGYLQPGETPVDLAVKLAFDGPFLVDDPPTKSEREKKKKIKAQEDHSTLPANHKPLRDENDMPRLPEKSIRGGLRSQAERIVRTLGVDCCDTLNSCGPVYSIEEVENKLCPVCKLFGAPGWKSPLVIHEFKCINEDKPESIRQDFVAIDRFTGGAKPTAKFDADYVYAPEFQGRIGLDKKRLKSEKKVSIAKGLLSLVLRDLRDGDITLGFGRAKGYGTCKAEIPNLAILSPDDNIKKFLNYFEIAPASLDTSPISTSGTNPEKSVSDQPRGSYQPNSFHNPYHFVPVVNPDVSKWLDKNKLKSPADSGLHTHNCYYDLENGKKVYNGRLLCRLKTKTPMFIGGKRTPGTEPQEIDPFELDEKCAIPATSLRGMLSSIVETASCSSMRVLEDKVLSRRMVMKESLPAMGMLLQTKNGLKLLPLALPSLKCNHDGQLMESIPARWREIFNVPCLKVYVDGYDPQNRKPSYKPGSFLDTKRPVSFSMDDSKFWYMKLRQNRWMEKNGQCKIDIKQHPPRIKTRPGPHGESYYLLGQKSAGGENPISQQKFDELDAPEQQQYTKGVLRVLGIDDRQSDIPSTKHHEIFLPFPDGYHKNKRLDVNDALAAFHKLADERAGVDEKYPFEVKGKKRPQVDGVSTLRLGHRDIVFFDIDGNGKVTELAVSSIWRKGIKGTVFDFFSSVGDNAAELLPFNPRRERISPAELLFGFVEDRKKEKKDAGEEIKEPEAALSFAGKVWVSFGRLAPGQDENVYDTPVTLKALLTPKPPSPALYFKSRSGSYIPKDKLSLERQDQAQGRKVYLHCYQQNGEIVRLDANGYPPDTQNNQLLNPWESKSNHLPDTAQDDLANLKVRVTPVTSGTSFYFHLDFDNLSQEELNLLCYSLRPDDTFQHKLGMGKPIGLGSVTIEPVGLFLVDRQTRYRTTVDSTRYNGVIWKDEDAGTDELPVEYVFERAVREQENNGPNPFILAVDYADTMNKDIKQALSLLGNPDKVVSPVHYPQVKNKDIEEETFLWFVDNDKRWNEHLRPLPSGSQPLPVLTRKDKL